MMLLFFFYQNLVEQTMSEGVYNCSNAMLGLVTKIGIMKLKQTVCILGI